MQPMVWPLSFLDRRDARRPTRKTTESRYVLSLAVSCEVQIPEDGRTKVERSSSCYDARGDIKHVRFHPKLAHKLLAKVNESLNVRVPITPAVPYVNAFSGFGCLAEAVMIFSLLAIVAVFCPLPASKQ